MDDHRERRAFKIADIAALAGVSTATVSRALSSPEKLRSETLAKVAEAVRRTGYTPNVAARTLRGRPTMVVLVVVPTISNLFFADVLHGVDDQLSANGYGLLIGSIGETQRRGGQMIDFVQAGRVDGVILMNGKIPEDEDRSLLDAGMPIVTICEQIPDTRFPCVMVQNREAGREAVAHLVGLGHRRLGYLSGPDGNIIELERRAGFREGLKAAGIPAASATYYQGDFTLRSGAAAAAAFLAAPNRPTALFAVSDEMAIGFIKVVRAAGIRVPQDVSVVGFDGIVFADYMEPTLTTFCQPRRELGQEGAALLVRAMNGETIAPTEAYLRLPVPLLARDSSGPCVA